MLRKNENEKGRYYGTETTTDTEAQKEKEAAPNESVSCHVSDYSCR